ncbi:MAG: hypothetical protein NVS9B14_11090 [Candidatus Acidiferrum sp.]
MVTGLTTIWAGMTRVELDAQERGRGGAYIEDAALKGSATKARTTGRIGYDSGLKWRCAIGFSIVKDLGKMAERGPAVMLSSQTNGGLPVAESK